MFHDSTILRNLLITAKRELLGKHITCNYKIAVIPCTCARSAAYLSVKGGILVWGYTIRLQFWLNVHLSFNISNHAWAECSTLVSIAKPNLIPHAGGWRYQFSCTTPILLINLIYIKRSLDLTKFPDFLLVHDSLDFQNCPGSTVKWGRW